jgi:hypothetical protein
MKIRKQVYELTLEDLGKFPVWEFALDEEDEEGQDEATVRPVQVSGTLDPADGPFIIRAMFTLADGTKMHGWLTVHEDDGLAPVVITDVLGTLQPVIITDRAQILFWYGVIGPSAQDVAKSYTKLGREAVSVFPIQVDSDVELVGEPIHATIPGFLVLEDWENGKTRTVT